MNTVWILIGVIFLIISLVMIIGAIVSRVTNKQWKGGNIALLVIGIIFLIISIILFIVGAVYNPLYYEPILDTDVSTIGNKPLLEAWRKQYGY